MTEHARMLELPYVISSGRATTAPSAGALASVVVSPLRRPTSIGHAADLVARQSTGEEGKRPPKILVVGSAGHSRVVTSYRWDKLPENINVADYDIAIFNFAAFEDRALADGFPVERLPSVETMARLIFSSDATVVAIGNPRTPIGPPPSSPSAFDQRRSADYFLPAAIIIEREDGTQIGAVTEGWEAYFELLGRFTWFATGELKRRYNDATYIRPVSIEANAENMRLQAVAETRYEKAIALRIRCQAVRVEFTSDMLGDRRVSNVDILRESSPVIWLPKPDRVSVEEAIDLLLREGFGVAEELSVPDWASAYELPEQRPIAEEVASIEEEQRQLAERLADAKRRGDEAAEPRKLLYEKRKEILEPIARDALRQLGAEVIEPAREGIDDGRLIVDCGHAVIEIKGTNGPIKLAHVRQVVQWASDAKGENGIEHKPLIVGNPHCNRPLEERGDSFAANARTYAENSGVALLTTAQLYEALRQKQLGQFDERGFWKTVFQTKGEAELPEPQRPQPLGVKAQ